MTRNQIAPVHLYQEHHPGILSVMLHHWSNLTSSHDVQRFEPLPYALIEFDASQIIVDALSGDSENALWPGDSVKHKFHVARLTDMIIRICLKSRMGQEPDVTLAVVVIKPKLDDSLPMRQQSYLTQDGTGNISLRMIYEPTKTTIIKSAAQFGISCGSANDVSVLKLRDTGQLFARKPIEIVDSEDLLQGIRNNGSRIKSTFVAPLTLAFKSLDELHLFSPLAQGGQLFYYLQRVHRFDQATARFFISEFVCALEHLRSLDLPLDGLKPEHLWLDALGHLVVCDFGFFSAGQNVQTEYRTQPPPSNSSEKAEPGRRLIGTFLLEMLAGSPLPQSDDPNETEISTESIRIALEHVSLTEPARDLLVFLLEPDLGEKSGANAFQEIRAHDFFHGIEWQTVINKGYTPPFAPYLQAPRIPQPPHEPGFWGWTIGQDIGGKKDSNTQLEGNSQATASSLDVEPSERPEGVEASAQHPSIANSDQEEDWDLVWDISLQTFRLLHRLTLQTKALPLLPEKPLLSDLTPSLESPPPSDLQSAFEAILSSQRFPLILKTLVNKYGLSPDQPVFSPARTALQFAASESNLPFTRILLSLGADPNIAIFTSQPRDFYRSQSLPPLLIAVSNLSPELLELVLSKSSRITRTRALARAVDTKYSPDPIISRRMASMLLEAGTECDFRPGDDEKAGWKPDQASKDKRTREKERTWQEEISRTRGATSWVPDDDRIVYDGCCFFTEYDDGRPGRDEFLPPLVRAVISGDEQVVRMLLAHGASPDTGYHMLKLPLESWPRKGDDDVRFGRITDVGFVCGRVVQLAMERGEMGIVQALLEAGASTELPQPERKGHVCSGVFREVWVKVRVELARTVKQRSTGGGL